MRQDFSGVTPERLAQLFPIFLVEHDPAWAEEYRREADVLTALWGSSIVRISHIGSTSVPGLLAKPTVDILLEIAGDTDLDVFTERMLDEGYVVNTPPDDLVLLLGGYTPRGFEGQAMHIHVRHSGDWDELYFRDYLRAHPEAAAEYAMLKAELQKRYSNDRDGYTAAKGEFVQRYTTLGRAEFPGRYTPANRGEQRSPLPK